jgi:hypothetical protein
MVPRVISKFFHEFQEELGEVTLHANSLLPYSMMFKIS